MGPQQSSLRAVGISEGRLGARWATRFPSVRHDGYREIELIASVDPHAAIGLVNESLFSRRRVGASRVDVAAVFKRFAAEARRRGAGRKDNHGLILSDRFFHCSFSTSVERTIFVLEHPLISNRIPLTAYASDLGIHGLNVIRFIQLSSM
jgi:hypothetical protein